MKEGDGLHTGSPNNLIYTVISLENLWNPEAKWWNQDPQAVRNKKVGFIILCLENLPKDKLKYSDQQVLAQELGFS